MNQQSSDTWNTISCDIVSQLSHLADMLLTMKSWSSALATLLFTVSTVGHYAQPYNTDGAELQIRNKLALYAIALDNKDFDLFGLIFTKNFVARLGLDPPQDVLRGLEDVMNATKVSVDGIVTQHTISTIFVNFTNLDEPTSISYLLATYLGQGDLTNQTVTFYGKYDDKWAFEDGSWKSKEKDLTLFVSLKT